MSVICRRFSENAWKKDLCSNCFRSEIEHSFDGLNRTKLSCPSNSPSTLSSPLDEIKVNLVTSYQNPRNPKETQETINGIKNGSSKVNNGSGYQIKSKEFNNGWSLEKKISLDTSNGLTTNNDAEELFSAKNKLNSMHLSIPDENNEDQKPSPEIITDSVCKGILKTSKSAKIGGKSLTVQFSGEPLVIGYFADDSDSGNDDDEDEDDESDENDNEDDFQDDTYSEEDINFLKVTKENTRFNSIEKNLLEPAKNNSETLKLTSNQNSNQNSVKINNPALNESAKAGFVEEEKLVVASQVSKNTEKDSSTPPMPSLLATTVTIENGYSNNRPLVEVRSASLVPKVRHQSDSLSDEGINEKDGSEDSLMATTINMGHTKSINGDNLHRSQQEKGIQEESLVCPTAIYSPGSDLFAEDTSSNSSSNHSSMDNLCKPTSLITGFYDNLQPGFNSNGLSQASDEEGSLNSNLEPVKSQSQIGGQKVAREVVDSNRCLGNDDDDGRNRVENNHGNQDSFNGEQNDLNCGTGSESCQSSTINGAEMYADGKSSNVTASVKEIPMKPVRLTKPTLSTTPQSTLSSSKPALPTKPNSLIGSRNSVKVEHVEGVSPNQEIAPHQISESVKDSFTDEEKFNNNNDQHNENSSSDQLLKQQREQRLAELAVELEQVRSHNKRLAPMPPPPSSVSPSSTCSISSVSSSSSPSHSPSPSADGIIDGNHTKSKSVGPPPRPPPPNLSTGRFSFKKFLNKKLSSSCSSSSSSSAKDHHDFVHDSSSEKSSLKAWKRSTGEFDRSKIQIIHPLEISTGTENNFGEATYESIPDILPEHGSEKSSKSRSYNVAPKPPSRKSKSTESLTNGTTNINHHEMRSKTPTSSFYVHLHPPPHPPPPPPQSSLPPPLPSSPPPNASSATQSLPMLSIPSTASSSSTLTHNGSPPLSFRSLPLTFENLTMADAYSSISKLNFEAINVILKTHFSEENKAVDPKDYEFANCEPISATCKLYKNSVRKLDNKSVNLLITPDYYNSYNGSCCDVIVGFIRVNENNTNLYEIDTNVDVVLTMDKLVLHPQQVNNISSLPFQLTVKRIAFILIQFITQLKSIQGCGMEEVTEEQLHALILCLSSSRENQIYVLGPKSESLVRNECMSLIPQFTLCQCAGQLLRNLNRFTNDGLLTKIEKIFEEERAQSLSLAKTMCEVLLFDVPLSLSSTENLKYYLDLKRAEMVVGQSTEMRTFINHCYLMFLNKSNRKSLHDAISRLRNN